jgi:GntR family transcriptional regulator, rspAB operon transcriptional repressor
METKDLATKTIKSGKESSYNILFDRIYKGEYAHGHRLKELDLASEFGMSRGPIRELLKQLADVGLVKILPNRGAIVMGLSQDDVEEIYEIRKSLEVLALRFAIPRISLNELSAFRARVTGIDKNTSADEIAQIDHALHLMIVEMSGRNYLKRMLERIYQLISRIRSISFHNPEGVALAKKEHLELIDAIFTRDHEKAAHVLSEHLERSKTVVLTTLFHRSFPVESFKTLSE